MRPAASSSASATRIARGSRKPSRSRRRTADAATTDCQRALLGPRSPARARAIHASATSANGTATLPTSAQARPTAPRCDGSHSVTRGRRSSSSSSDDATGAPLGWTCTRWCFRSCTAVKQRKPGISRRLGAIHRRLPKVPSKRSGRRGSKDGDVHARLLVTSTLPSVPPGERLGRLAHGRTRRWLRR